MRTSNFLLMILISTLAGCASVNITSKPPAADVILAVPGQETGKLLGKTPLQQNLSEITKLSNRSTIVVTLKKPGYRSQNFVIPNLGGGKLEIEANLLPIGSDDSADINIAVRYLLEAEKYIIEKNFKEALKVLEKSRASNPNIAAAYTFEGTIYMLQNQVEKAREAFYKALALDPQDTEVRALLAETGGNTDAPPAGKGKGRGKR
ncbi:MAG: hypothetical protein RI953_2160 [Pseudomonadota bacterium]|jgi:hypothetical protein